MMVFVGIFHLQLSEVHDELVNPVLTAISILNNNATMCAQTP